MHLFEKRNFTFTTSLITLRHDDPLNWVQPSPIFLFGIICGPGWGSFTVEDHLRTILGSFAVLREANSHTPAPRVGENPGNDVDEDVLRGSSRVPAPLVGLVGKHTEICKADRTMWKLTLQDINTTPKEPKAERGRSRRQLFLPFRGSSVERLCCKIPAQERLRGRLAPCMAMIVQKLRPQTPDFPAENTWGVEFLGGTHFRDTLGSKFPDQFSLRQRTSDLFEKRSGYERSHFKPAASRVCLFWVSSFEKYVTVFSWILVYWCYGFWHRLPEEIIILVIFDKSVFFFSFFGGIWILGMEGLHMSFWQSRLVMALWCQKKIEKRLLQLCLGFKRRISKKRYAIIVLDKNDYVYDYVLKNSHKCRVFKSNNDGDGHQNLKVNRAYSILFNSSTFGKCFWSWIMKDCIKVQEKKKRVVVLCSRPPKTWN